MTHQKIRPVLTAVLDFVIFGTCHMVLGKHNIMRCAPV
jgi:hypothetical protein